MAEPPTIHADTLRQLARLLATGGLNALALADQLGARRVDLQGNILVQEPSISGVASASVVREIGSNEVPKQISLDLEAPITLGELEAAFGAAKIVAPEHPGQNRGAVFQLDQPDGEFDIRLIGALEVRGGDAIVRGLTLMRDIKLRT